MRIASPLIAIGLTLVTMTVLFALSQETVCALWVYFIDSAHDAYSLAGDRSEGNALVMIALGLSLCYLANV